MKKVLIVAGGLQLGGAERVAANLSKFAPTEEFEFHYLVFEGIENVYGPEIEARGGKVFTWPAPSHGYGAYIRRLGQLIEENQYDAVHSHTMFNSGLNLLIARKKGVKCTIAHSHTTKTETKVSLPQKLYENFMRMLIRRNADFLLACGEEAGRWMYGNDAFVKRGLVIKNGIDTDAFRYNEQYRASIRRQYHITNDAFVIGHSGTLLPLKNQELLITLMPQILQRIPNAHLLLVGKGSEEMTAKLQALAGKLGVAAHTTFCGGVLNVNEHLSAMDVFAFPSTREGTPLALLEAQANGLPCIISDRIPPDAFLTDLIHPLSLDEKNAWIDALCQARRTDPADYADAVAASGYGVQSSYAPIYDIYRFERKCVVSLSFDDARGDNTYIFNHILLPKQLPFTLNVTTGYVDGSCPKELRPCDKPAMNQADVISLGNHPLAELALHGDFHQNTLDDIRSGRKKLAEWMNLSENASFGFASPGSGFSIADFRSEPYRDFRDSLKYMRISLRIQSLRPIRVLARKAGRVIHLPLLYRIAYHDTLMELPEGKVVYSVPVMKDTTIAQLKALIDLSIRRKCRLVLMFHSVLPDTVREDNWSWPQEQCEKLCSYLVQKRECHALQIETTENLFR